MKAADFRNSPLYGQWHAGKDKPRKRPTIIEQVEEPLAPLTGDDIIEITLPFCPSVNHYMQHTSRGSFITRAGNIFIRSVVEYIKETGLVGRIGASLVDVAVVLHPPTGRIYDIDNYSKVSFDSLTKAGFWDDDSQVRFFAVHMGETIKRGQIDIAVKLHVPAAENTSAADILKRIT
jgi:crossover junction endodeoxyribonuclease RusA